MNNLLYYNQQVKSILSNIFISAVSHAILNLLLIRSYGLLGAGIAFMLGNAIWSLCTTIQHYKLKSSLLKQTNF